MIFYTSVVSTEYTPTCETGKSHGAVPGQVRLQLAALVQAEQLQQAKQHRLRRVEISHQHASHQLADRLQQPHAVLSPFPLLLQRWVLVQRAVASAANLNYIS